MIDHESPLVGFLHFRHLLSGVHRCLFISHTGSVRLTVLRKGLILMFS
jgi:hypothetical protein